jgi:hypothetical protein
MFLQLAFLGVPFKVVCESREYPRHFRVANIGGEMAALFLYFRQGLWAFRHDSGMLKQPDARNY